MNDEEFDDLLRDAAATYNVPPAPPREAMWSAIETARSSAAVVPIASVRRLPRWMVSAVGAAAVLLIGIAIGRQSLGDRSTSTALRPQSSPPHADSQRVSTVQPSELAQSGSRDTEAGSQREPDARIAGNSTSQRDVRGRLSARRLGARATRAGEAAPNVAGNETFNDVDAYRLAVVEHLTRSEVLLTGFRADARTGKAAKLDAQFAAVSRELLSTTRMLLATRRGEDPAITRLLQDLEYVLMQLSQYANDGRGVDLDAINQSIDRRNLLPKLRNSIPAGVSSSAGT